MIRKLMLFALATMIIFSCSRTNQDHNLKVQPDVDKSQLMSFSDQHTGMRMEGNNYSQPISIDTANRMIGSYLSSVNYPTMDTALRCLSFDADTLRAYLKDSRIVTIKFIMAHQNTFINTAGNYGKYIGMRPGGLTVIIAGIDDNSQLIRNSSNGVFEHAIPCPVLCPTEADPYLH